MLDIQCTVLIGVRDFKKSLTDLKYGKYDQYVQKVSSAAEINEAEWALHDDKAITAGLAAADAPKVKSYINLTLRSAFLINTQHHMDDELRNQTPQKILIFLYYSNRSIHSFVHESS